MKMVLCGCPSWGRPMNSSHQDQRDSGLGGPLIWIITALLALVAVAMIVSFLPSKRIEQPAGLRIHEPLTGLSERRLDEPPTALPPKPR